MAKVIISVLAGIAFSLGIITALNYGVYFVKESNSTATDGINDSYIYIANQSGITVLSKDDEPSYGLNLSYKTDTMKNVLHLKTQILEYKGICQVNGLIFSFQFTDVYQKIYSSFFVIVIVVVVVLYILIYKFVSVRRAKRRRMRSQRSMYSSYKDPPTTYVNTRASINNGSIKTEVDMTSVVDEPRPKTEKTAFLRRMTIREKGLVANIRTAAMLFVVTAVFIIVFLPAWLMAHEVLPYNMLIFYMYFFYNVANPIIYAFMNKAFRRDLKDVIECRVSQ
ncbi:5-hydroxytryptamine receptor 1F-like [Ruditapes philippinarum]|uniref:5-hydroxytryptamine receptor 1F-like n=1 Tax=Ruditapes philippinarum TaxID=129788 RepID=UPI00295B38F6|nr:5-hydroxytryptamine receptor 1F-like [Ruditapes philippinarum]